MAKTRVMMQCRLSECRYYWLTHGNKPAKRCPRCHRTKVYPRYKVKR